jgi:hypothetical protein
MIYLMLGLPFSARLHDRGFGNNNVDTLMQLDSRRSPMGKLST